MAARNDIVQFLNNAENAQKLNGLVDDIREAVVDYQVRTSKGPSLSASNVLAQTSLQRDIYDGTRQLIVSFLP